MNNEFPFRKVIAKDNRESKESIFISVEYTNSHSLAQGPKANNNWLRNIESMHQFVYRQYVENMHHFIYWLLCGNHDKKVLKYFS